LSKNDFVYRSTHLVPRRSRRTIYLMLLRNYCCRWNNGFSTMNFHICPSRLFQSK